MLPWRHNSPLILIAGLVVVLVQLQAGCVVAWVHLPTCRTTQLSSLSSSSSSSSSSSALWSTVEEGFEVKVVASASPEPPPPSASTLLSIEKLSPEYKAALDAANQKMFSNLPSEPKELQTKMYPLLSHFLAEYLAANQEAYRAGQEPELTRPDAAARRFVTGTQYGLAYGVGPSRFQFGVAHTALRGRDPEREGGNTIDFYQFGCDFFRTCMDLARSQILGQDRLRTIIEQQIAAGENVVLFANHQSEADPQVVSACLESLGYGKQAEDIVYVAGHKVTTDPLAVPFSMGRNLICIHSKKHIDADPSTKPVKQKQNLLAMNSLLEKLKAGSCLLWVAPSGGRDRRNVETGEVPLAPFDAKTIDIFRLFGTKSRVPTHYYTLAMVTYELCPPPDFVEAGVGEERNVRFAPVGIHLGQELPSVGGLETRHEFTNRAYAQCQRDYDQLRQAILAGGPAAEESQA